MSSETPQRGLDKAPRARRSDRVSIRIPVSVVALDLHGHDTIQNAVTHTVTRYGASIITSLGLIPQQEITLSRGKGLEALARVVGQMGAHPDGAIYGIAFLDPEIDFWGIQFPPPDEQILAKVLLECVSCGARSIVSLNEVELEVFRANQRITRRCDKCRDVTTWKQAEYDARPEPEPVRQRPFPAQVESAPAPKPPGPAPDRRAYRRVTMKVTACIQQARGAEKDIVAVLDMSRGGIRIRSINQYAVGLRILIAAPYTEGTANILVPARVVRRAEVPGAYEYGIKYVKD